MERPDISGQVKSYDLRDLRAELLRQQIRHEEAEAELSLLELEERRAKERDRLARPGLHRRLPISGPIMGSNIDMWIEALEHWEMRDPGQPITVTIDSPGGDVLGGFGIFDTILRLRRKGHFVTTRGRGMIASMAAVLLQAGDERVMDANAQLMIHEISFGARGKVSEIEDFENFAKKLQKRVLDILSERSKLTARQIASRWKKTDWWMSAEEALELGFIDAIE